MQFFQETTKWKDAVPNGIYLLDDSKSKMYAFIKAGEKSAFTFKNPIRISTRGRTFVPVKNTFNYKIKEDTVEQKWTVTGSKGDKYIVRMADNMLQCSCTGYKYHGKCKHADQIQKEIK